MTAENAIQLTADPACVVCGGRVASIGSKRGTLFVRDFHFAECPACGVIFCTDPATNYDEIYDQNYYRGLGADPLVDYEFEVDNPERSIRQFEWRGIGRVVRELSQRNPNARWLDYGCGTGGLVRYGRDVLKANVFGFDTGGYAERARANGLPILTREELEAAKGTFDVITLVEVIEHISDPVPFMIHLRTLLRPGGRLFLTTGNSAPHRPKFLEWGYVVPEIHVCFYTPEAVRTLYARSGFESATGAFSHGWRDIIRFKVLKNLGLKCRPGWQALVPWSVASRVVDSHFRLSSFPVGVVGTDGRR